MDTLGLSVSELLFKKWSTIFVAEYAPYFLTKFLHDNFSTYVLLTHSEFHSTFRDLSFHDAYRTYEVGKEASSVILLSSQDLQNLPNDVRLELLQLQASLNRGQIYNFGEYKNYLKDSELEYAQGFTFDYEGKEMLELNHTLWHSFSFETQKRWLARFVSEDRTDCLSTTLSKKEWQAIHNHYPAVKQLIGYADSSGPNCFATTLAASLDVEKARYISSLWLQGETFLREIEKRSYQKSELEVNADLPDGSILVWQNDKGIQHACFYLGNGLVFNKDAQTWFAPRQILKLESVLESWQDFEVLVYVNHQQPQHARV